MDPVIFVEVFDHRGRMQRREVVTAFPVRLGRSYRNDVILDDPRVDPEHAELRVAPDGTLVLADLGSVNGIRRTRRGRRRPRIRVKTGTRVWIGGTPVRFCTADQPVAPAVAHATGVFADSGILQRGPGAILAVVAGLTVLAMGEGIGDTGTEANAAATAFGVTIGFGFLLLLWAVVWGLIQRGVVKRFRLLPHLAWVSLVAAALWLVSRLFEYVSFALPHWGWLEGAEGLVMFVGFAGLILGHLALMDRPRGPPRLVMALGIAMALEGMSLALGDFEEASENRTLTINAPVKPVPPALVAGTSIEAWSARMERVRVRVDALAERASTRRRQRDATE